MSVNEIILEQIAKVVHIFWGSANDRELARLWPIVEKVNAAWETIRPLSDEALRARTDEFRRRLIQGESEDDILPEAFAVCREASHRTLGGGRMVEGRYHRITFENGKFVYRPEEGKIPLFAHFDVQILGGTVLHEGKIAEMVTGEGKTLVATLPAYLNALRPCEEWIETAKRLQGENVAEWTFRPYARRPGGTEWELADRLTPPAPSVDAGGEPVEAAPWEPPEAIVPLSRGIHIVTTNDYLAGRDAEYVRPLFDFLGVRVGAIQSSMSPPERIPVYMGDIVYGTNNEFGFDYLRDNLRVRAEDQVQRSRYFAIIDEVDNILIDEARTPLIISGSTQESTENYYKADKVARQLTGGDQLRLDDTIAGLMKQGWTREDARIKAEEDWDYVFSERDHSAKLTERGMHKALRLLGMEDIYAGDNLGMPHHIDNALRAHALYKRDHHYIVRDGQVLIVDEFTGRIMEGRRWSDGLHQAVEAKEHLRIKEESQTVATITFQNFFRLYDRLGGMTGTAMTEAKEFDRTYGLGIVSVPTNRPLRRHNYPDLIYGTAKEKFDAIVEHIAEVHATGRPILIGTVSIERSEIISALLKRRGVPHEVLNAKHHAREAQIVAGAGGFGQVTVATNMAGRGTDIVLGTQEPADLLEHWQRWGLAPKKGLSPEMPEAELSEALRHAWVRHYLPDVDADYEEKTAEEWDRLLQRRWEESGLTPPTFTTRVAEMGGLHIVGTERHEARRIDNQLRGRAGRQGDPGSSRFFLSLEDDTMRLFASEKVSGILRRIGLSEGIPIESRMVTRTVENAQKKVEERNYEIRKNLLEYDSVMNEQRQLVYDRRQSWVEGRDLRESMVGFCEDVIDARVRQAAEAEDESGFDTAGLSAFMADTFLVEIRPGEIASARTGPEPEQAVSDLLAERLRQAYDAREGELGAEAMRTLEKLILLETLDRKWMDHLYEMDLLKEGIHLRGYAGQDPKIRYKREGYEIFEQLWQSLEDEVAGLVLRVKPVEQMNVEEQVEIRETVHEDFDAYADETSQIGQGIGEAGAHAEPIVNTIPKVGRNDPCPCGSGRKYKKCCGR